MAMTLIATIPELFMGVKALAFSTSKIALFPATSLTINLNLLTQHDEPIHASCSD